MVHFGPWLVEGREEMKIRDSGEYKERSYKGHTNITAYRVDA